MGSADARKPAAARRQPEGRSGIDRKVDVRRVLRRYRAQVLSTRAVRAQDALLPGGLGLLAVVELVALGPAALAGALALELLAVGLLVPRHRFPMASGTLAGIAVLALPLVGTALDEPAAPVLVTSVAGFTVARRVPDQRGIASLLVFLALILIGERVSEGTVPGVSDLVFVLALLAPPYVFGRVLRSLAVRNAQLHALQETVRRDAIVAERARVARELHDVIAHSVSAMVLQASAAEDLVHTDPDRARAVVHDVAGIGRRALAETGRLLHLLRDEEGELGLEPEVGMERLHELTAQLQASGLSVELDVQGELTGLPAGVDLSGYRIVQEALTNVLRHSGDRAARVLVRRTPSRLTIEVENRRGTSRSTDGAGLGLIGMAERVSVFGGSLHHGPTADGRFVLQAALPLDET